jgi:hypothetical protein
MNHAAAALDVDATTIAAMMLAPALARIGTV